VRLATHLVLIGALLLAACGKSDLSAPPKATSTPEVEARNSTLVVPIEMSLDRLQQRLNSKAPRQLWSIDKKNMKCASGKRVKLLGKKRKVTPDIDCDISGQVTRGTITLGGSGQQLTISMPVNATVRARDIGGVLKGETATASAVVRATISVAMDRDWNASARVQIAYDWTEPPGIDFLGQRVKFVEKADAKLAKVIAELEQEIQQEVAEAKVRPLVAEAWEKGFTNIRLSRRNPPAWLRITPRGMGLVGYEVNGRKFTLTIAVLALAETFIGIEPDEPAPTPLPPQIPPPGNGGLSFFMPVVADYSQIEAVALKKLRKLATKGIVIDGVGSVNAQFNKVTVYATDDNRLAVGVDAVVEPIGERTGVSFGKTTGTVWMTAVPVTEANSRVVRISDLQIYGNTDGMGTNLLLRLAATDRVRNEIAGALVEDLTKDYNKVLGKAERALAAKQVGNFRLSARIGQVRHEKIQVTGAGLFTNTVVTGTGELVYSPETRKPKKKKA